MQPALILIQRTLNKKELSSWIRLIGLTINTSFSLISIIYLFY